ncbi:MAG: class I SAM-dependent methyltransferase, partial [Chthoniobacterales bacterium]
PPVSVENSLFERFAWLYAFFRERLFRDDTERIAQEIWRERKPVTGTRLIELGCGPGFYSCQLAERFPELTVLGVDCAERQLEGARQKARERGLMNCKFAVEDVLALSHEDQSFDALIAARLFTVLPDQEHAVSEMYRVLRPGGRCFVAEPRYAIWASLPLLAMWLLAGISGMNNRCREPRKATVLSGPAFKALFASQPWRKMRTWQDGRYQYALCEKG